MVWIVIALEVTIWIVAARVGTRRGLRRRQQLDDARDALP